MESLKKFWALHREIVVHVAGALVGFVIVMVAFGLLADEVHEGDTLRFDREILLWINSYSSLALNNFVIRITEFGGVAFIAAVTVIIGAYLVSKRLYVKTFMFVAAIGGAALLNVILKLLFERARPELWQRIIEESNFSFPSGHAMGSSALAFAIIALLWNTRWRIPAIILGALYICMIGLSRLYLGVHYPTDILGGWLVSLAWVLAVGIIVYTHLYNRRRAKGLPEKES